MKLRSSLGELTRRLNVSDLRLERETGVNREHIQKIREGTFRSISRRELQILWSWGRRRDPDFDLFSLVRHPIWAPFEKGDAVIIRGKGDRMNALILDARVEHLLEEFLDQLPCRAIVKMQPEISTAAQVRQLMTTQSCIFLGSPKHNPAVTMAIAALWNVDADDASKAGRDKVPFWFAWGQPLPGQGANAFAEPAARGSSGTGIYVNRGNGTKNPGFVGVSWLPGEQYIEWSGTGWDAGVLIIARQPLGTKRDVMTMVIAGYTGLGTIEVAQDLLNDAVDIEESALLPGQPTLRILRFPYRKLQGADVREPKMKGRMWLRPPWNRLTGASPQAESGRGSSERRRRA